MTTQTKILIGVGVGVLAIAYFIFKKPKTNPIPDVENAADNKILNSPMSASISLENRIAEMQNEWKENC